MIHLKEVTLFAFGQLDVENTTQNPDDVTGETDTSNHPCEDRSAEMPNKIPVSKNIDTCVDDILIAIANFIAFSQIMVDCSWSISPDNPTIINWLLELASMVSDPETLGRLDRAAKEKPYIYHSVFLYFQDLFAKFGFVIGSTNAVKMLLDGKDVDPSSYKTALIFFLTAKDSIADFSKGANIQGYLSSETPSFHEFGSGTRVKAVKVRDFASGIIRVKAKVPIKPHFEIIHKNHKREEWLTVKPGHDRSVVQEFDFPAGVRNFCLLLAFQGLNCNSGKDCWFEHLRYPKDFEDNLAEKEALEEYIEKSGKFCFIGKDGD